MSRPTQFDVIVVGPPRVEATAYQLISNGTERVLLLDHEQVSLSPGALSLRDG